MRRWATWSRCSARDGGDVITVSEMAAAAELSAYEILTGLKLRLPRRYVADELGVAAA